MASVDPAEKRRLFERLSSVREIVFGVQDGVLTTAGVLCGLSGAVSQHSQVVLAALASTAAGALSMGAGAYLGTRAETEVLSAELELVRVEAAAKPYTVQEGLLDELCKEGLSREAGYRIVRLLSTAPKALASTAEAKMFGLTGGTFGRPALDGIVMGLAFLAGAVVPLLPYMLIPGPRYDLGGALVATALTLFGVGYFAGWLAHRDDRWRSGVRFLAIAMSAAAVGYLIGLAISPLGATAG
ncbi:MAG: VIT1/CCC1 transporter family protein [Candidatus Binatus sp.]|uniref:VIT1/CCC1 transporter family protein n=1 Tax=Candidatus Binatus sp. TaxID=2811406 RepID=UPI003D127C03